MVTVSIEGENIFVNESGGFVEVCMMADHDSQASYEVILTTMDGSAMGKDCRITSVHVTYFPS